MSDEDPKPIPGLARRRKSREELEAARGSREAEKLATLTFVIPPLATTLKNIQSVIATEVAFIQQGQSATNQRLDLNDAKKLQALTSALSQSINSEKEVTQAQLDDMSDEEVERALLAEVEKIRAKRGREP